MIINAQARASLPVYGDGVQIEDWLDVGGRCSAVRRVLDDRRARATYNIGGWNEKPNVETVHTACDFFNELCTKGDGSSYATLITYVAGRQGHGRRHAIDARKIEREPGWKPAAPFETGIRKNVQRHPDHAERVANLQSGAYREWVAKQYQGVTV